MAGIVSVQANSNDSIQSTQMESKKPAKTHKKAKNEKAEPTKAVAEKASVPKEEDSMGSRALTIGKWAVGIVAALLILFAFFHVLLWGIVLGLTIGALGYLIGSGFVSWGFWGAILGIPAGIIHAFSSRNRRGSYYSSCPSEPMAINPANGLPMVGGTTTGFDVSGNVYGTDNNTFNH